ncbi:Pol [Symbiodinium sp. CCMP2592]|nr:Pol [Symbiodinium sp. CCMP2592]
MKHDDVDNDDDDDDDDVDDGDEDEMKPHGPSCVERALCALRVCVGVGAAVWDSSVKPRMSHDEAAASSDYEDPEELTPWDHRDGDPPRPPFGAGPPRGPPPPMPVGGALPARAIRAAARDTPPLDVDTEQASGPGDWEWDHPDGPQPVLVYEENVVRRLARVAGPLLPSGRFEASSSSSSSSTDGEGGDTSSGRTINSPPAGEDPDPHGDNDLEFSDTSLYLEGQNLADAKEFIYGQYRLECMERAESEGVELSSRSLAGQVGAAKRRLGPLDWARVQSWARVRLTGPRAERWHDYEYRATHELPRGRRDRSAPDFELVNQKQVTPGIADDGIAEKLPTGRAGPFRHFKEPSLVEHIPGKAIGPAKLAGPLTDCPVGAWPKSAAADRPTLNVVALQDSVQAGDPKALALRATVAAKLQQLPVALDLVQLRTAVNNTLLELATAKADLRVCAQADFKASAKQTWALYHQAKRPGPRSLQRLLQQWRYLVLFRRASQSLRQQSREIKRDFYLRQVAEAEQAAANGDQRGLYSVIRRLKSKGRQRASRTKNPDQTPMLPEQEMQAVLQYSRSTFACMQDACEPAALLEGLALSNEEYAAQLKSLGLRKAVPQHVAPTAIWRLCATDISRVLGPALRQHFDVGRQPVLDEDWTAAYISWLPKPGKRPEQVGDMRPIGLMCPSSKALAGSIRQKLVGTLHELLRWLPQFA